MGAYETEIARYVTITVSNYSAENLYVAVKNADGNIMEEAEFTQSDSIYSYSLQTLLVHNKAYTVTVITDRGTAYERTKTYSFNVINTYKAEQEEITFEEERETIETYLKTAVEQGLLGNYYEGDSSAGGIGVTVAIGCVPIVGQIADIRDISADLVNWEWSLEHVGYTVIDVAAIIPGLDVLKGLKYTDEALMIVKRGDKEIFIDAEEIAKGDEVVGYAVKHGDELVTAVGKSTDEVIEGGTSSDLDGIRIINKKYAGKTYTLSGELAEKYPNGVKFSDEGFPDFEPYSIKKVTIDDLEGDAYYDFIKANAKAGYSDTPAGYTWHHVEDGRTMILVPSDLHGAVRHTGGASLIRKGIRP